MLQATSISPRQNLDAVPTTETLPLPRQFETHSSDLGAPYVWKRAKRFTVHGLGWEVAVRVTMVALICFLQFTPAFERIVQVAEMHHYAFPYKESLSFVTMTSVTIVCGYVVFLPAFKMYQKRVQKRTDLNTNWEPESLSSKETRYATTSLFWTELLAFTLALSMACLSNMCFTNIIKSMYGEPRPDFFSRCFPSRYAETMDTLGIPFTPSSLVFECEERDTFSDNQLLIDGRKSFPSGHSSMITAQCYVIVWYVMERAFPTASDDDDIGKVGLVPGVKFFGYLVGCIPVIFVLIGRTRDYRHHWNDVCVGTLIGVVFGYLSVMLYFHSRLSRTRILQLTHQHIKSTAGLVFSPMYDSVLSTSHNLSEKETD